MPSTIILMEGGWLHLGLGGGGVSWGEEVRTCGEGTWLSSWAGKKRKESQRG